MVSYRITAKDANIIINSPMAHNVSNGKRVHAAINAKENPVKIIIASLLVAIILAFIIYAICILLIMPKTDIFLISANFYSETNAVNKLIAATYSKMHTDETCSVRFITDSKDVIKIENIRLSKEMITVEDARLSFVAALAEYSANDKEHEPMNKKVIEKELSEASKYCGETNFTGKIDAQFPVIVEYPVPIYIIFSQDSDYFKIIAENCVSFDIKYTNKRNITHTPRETLRNLISRTRGNEQVIYGRMMDILRENDVKCSRRS